MTLIAMGGYASQPPIAPEPSTIPSAIPELVKGTGVLAGYLSAKELPDSVALLPPPPEMGSPSVTLAWPLTLPSATTSVPARLRS